MRLAVVILWIQQRFGRQNRGSCLATNVIDVIFDANAPNVRSNRFSMRMVMHKVRPLTMAYGFAFYPKENHIS